MEEGSWGSVMQRAMVAGFTMGVLLGALLGVLIPIAVDVDFTFEWSPQNIFALILLGVLGGFVGALAGVVSSIPVGLVLAAERRHLRHRPRLARIHASGLAGLVLTSILLLSGGPSVAAVEGDGEWIAVVFALGLALGGVNARFIVTGEECRVARWLAHSGS